MIHLLVWLRRVALVEAVSYVLLLSAMVVKYGGKWPIGTMLVRVTGMAHGVLFLLMVLLLLATLVRRHWSRRRLLVVFVASLLPIVPFFLDRHLKDWIREGQKP